jgi:hypothetical protein
MSEETPLTCDGFVKTLEGGADVPRDSSSLAVDLNCLNLTIAEMPNIAEHAVISLHRFDSPWLVDQTYTCYSRLPGNKTVHSCGQAMPIFIKPQFAELNKATIDDCRKGIEVDVAYWPDDFLTTEALEAAYDAGIVHLVCKKFLYGKLTEPSRLDYITKPGHHVTLVSAHELPYTVRVCLEATDWLAVFKLDKHNNTVLLETSAMKRPHRTADAHLNSFFDETLQYDMGRMTMQEACDHITTYADTGSGFIFHDKLDTYIMRRQTHPITAEFVCYRLHFRDGDTSGTASLAQYGVTELPTGVYKHKRFSLMLDPITRFSSGDTNGSNRRRHTVQCAKQFDENPCFGKSVTNAEATQITPDSDKDTFTFLAYERSGKPYVAREKSDQVIDCSLLHGPSVYTLLPKSKKHKVSTLATSAQIHMKTTIRQGAVERPTEGSPQVRLSGYNRTVHGKLMSVVMATFANDNLPAATAPPVQAARRWLSARPRTKVEAFKDSLNKVQITEPAPLTPKSKGKLCAKMTGIRFGKRIWEEQMLAARGDCARIMLDTFGIFTISTSHAHAACSKAGISQWTDFANLSSKLPSAIAKILNVGVLVYTLPAPADAQEDDDLQQYTHKYYTPSGVVDQQASPENPVYQLEAPDKAEGKVAVVIDTSFRGATNTGFLVHKTAFCTLLRKPHEEIDDAWSIRRLRYEDIEDIEDKLEPLTQTVAVPRADGQNWNDTVRTVVVAEHA